MRHLVLLIACLAALHPARVHGAGGADSSRGGVRLLSHHASVTILPEHRSLVCVDTLLLRVSDANAESVSVRLHPAFSVEETVLDGEHVEHTFRGGTLAVRRRGADSMVVLRVAYSGRVDFPSEFTRITPERAVLREEEVLPFAERDLRSGTVRVTVPGSWSAITAGTLEDIRDSGSTRTFVYSWTEPIPSIGWICAGPYDLSVDRPGRVSIATYRFRGDSAAGANPASLADSVLAYYETAFSPYPYDRLSIVEVDDWLAGRGIIAIAAPGFIMVKRTAFLTDDPYNRVETVLPHEIAHQWWPAIVFVDDRDGAFLSEGLCEYSSMLYSEFRGDLGARDTLGRHPLLRPLLSRVRQGRDTPLSGKQDLRYNPSQYLKSAYVHHMLRAEMGDSAYAALLRQYVRRFRHRTATLEDFAGVAGEVSSRDLQWFFTQWVRSGGLPSLKIYNVRRERGGPGWKVTGRFRVVGYEKYTATVVLELRTAADTLRSRVRIGVDGSGVYRNDVPFEFVTAHTPLAVVVDPGGDLLKLRKLPAKLGDLRDPSDGVMIVGTLRDGPFLRSLAVKDSALLDRMGWSVVIREDREVTLADLQRKAVFLYGGVERNSAVAGLVGSFPLVPRGDTVTIGGETIRDGSLTLFQVAENPHLSDALICWIAPLGTGARSELRPSDKSWVLTRGKDEIASGTWEVRDDNLEVWFGPGP